MELNKLFLAVFVFLISQPLSVVAAEGSTEAVRGLIKPVQKATLSSQIAARITSMPFRPGDKFKKGDLLVNFDCAFYQVDLASAEATYNSKKKILENNKQLLALNAMSEIDVSISESDVEIAQAERRMRSIRVEQCRIRAPYNGRVIEVLANEHETVPADKELLSVLNDQELEIELIVPSNWLNWLKTDQEFSFHVDETGREFDANIIKIGAVVDPVSQTVKLTGSFENDSDQVLAGMSGTARFANTTNEP
jgi:RND family efflux transporter MFP subunit